MPRGEMRVPNRKTEEPYIGDWWEVVYGMGMPFLYISGLICGTIGCICMGIITHYWSNLSPAMCFLYSSTASSSVVYQFGGPLAACNWVTYGAVTGLVLATLTGIVYVIKVRGEEDLDAFIYMVVVGIVLSALFLLASSCTLSEGFRLTCSAMGLNSANNRGVTCFDKLDVRVSQYNLPIPTSTMVRSSLYSLWASTFIFFAVTCFHLTDLHRRTLRH
ncbi:uncharacterized protein LOC121869223 [Homarus americanus]|uniref:Uncharacterized protein n=1 Tax=Homarus americanus TaxID=6706 RepID=A0A8J5K846_HOMAM|nr:uncharacterized protein LOC121869223 [Homarus americanus]KAG7166584.1 hypothetical protein Hamer_G023546 [Homarus americanus]